METGIILKAIREETTAMRTASLVIIALSSLFLVLGWNLIYNTRFGPFPLTLENLTDSDKYRLRGTGDLDSLGVEHRELWYGTAIVSAKYMETDLGSRKLIVKVSTDYSGGKFVGRRRRLTWEMVDALLPPSRAGFLIPSQRWEKVSEYYHPYYIDCVGQGISPIGFVINVLIFLSPFTLLLGVISFVLFQVRVTKPELHPGVRHLRKLGPFPSVIDNIERELQSLEHNSSASVSGEAWGGERPLFYSSRWVLLTSPLVRVYPATDLIGFGHDTRARVLFWIRGAALPETFKFSEDETQRVLDHLKIGFHSKYKSDVVGFQNAWDKNRKEIERRSPGTEKQQLARDNDGIEKSVPETPPKFCTSCGKPGQVDARFCVYCGALL